VRQDHHCHHGAEALYATSGSIRLDGVDINAATPQQHDAYRKSCRRSSKTLQLAQPTAQGHDIIAEPLVVNTR